MLKVKIDEQKMSNYLLKSAHIEFHYGYDPNADEFWYEVYDVTRKHINGGLIEKMGTRLNNLPMLVLAEKLKQFKAPTIHIQKVLLNRII